jgi:hypothetical protein
LSCFVAAGRRGEARNNDIEDYLRVFEDVLNAPGRRGVGMQVDWKTKGDPRPALLPGVGVGLVRLAWCGWLGAVGLVRV